MLMTAAFGDNCEDVRQIWSKESFSDTYSSAHFVPNKGTGPNMYYSVVRCTIYLKSYFWQENSNFLR